MKKLTLFLLCLLPSLLQAQSPPPSQGKPLVFTHVTVIDATGAAAKPNMTVVITGDRITALGKTSRVKIPKGAQVVDATGKFLIPGLWDMHVHIFADASMKETHLPLLIPNGVTGVRDLGTSDELVQLIGQWREDIAAGVLLAPRIVTAGRILDGPDTQIFTAVHSASAGRAAVTRAKREGSDFLKVYNLLPRDTYFAIVDEARKQHIPFAGHVPFAVSAAEASDAGQKSIEHLTGVVLASSDRETELRKELAELPTAVRANAWSAFLRAGVLGLESYSEQKAQALFARLVKNGTWMCPALTMTRGSAFADDPDLSSDSRWKYLSPDSRRRWNPRSDPEFKPSSEDQALRKMHLKHLDLVGAMRRAGVAMLAGTDDRAILGFGLHDELELMVQAGLTPMEALQTATLNPARYLGREKELGTIEAGKLADLVLLEANPLTDIRNTQKINAVIVNGRLLDRAKLDQMLADVEDAANLKP